MPLLSVADARRLVAGRPGLLAKLGLGPDAEVRPLASGEYHQNFLLEDGSQSPPLVLRINHGSQLGLDEQLAYEADALRATVRLKDGEPF